VVDLVYTGLLVVACLIAAGAGGWVIVTLLRSQA